MFNKSSFNSAFARFGFSAKFEVSFVFELIILNRKISLRLVPKRERNSRDFGGYSKKKSMKKLIFLVFILAIISCKKNNQQEHYSFSGFGKLKIGNSISTLHQELTLQPTNDEVVPNEKCFSSENYKLSNEIGNVKNIFIRTYYDKIYHVAFDTDSLTNRLELSKLIFTDSLQLLGKLKDLEFQSIDMKVDLSINTSKEKNTYFYTNVQVWQTVHMKKDSIFRAKFHNF